MIILASIFFVGSAILGYLYYSKYKAYKNLTTENQNLQNKQQNAAALQKKLNTANSLIASLEKTKSDLTKESAAKSDKIKQSLTYRAFFAYLNQVIEAHPTMTGITDAEYEQGRALAQATGNNNFVNIVDTAWNNTDGDPVARLLSVWKGIASGWEDSLQ